MCLGPVFLPLSRLSCLDLSNNKLVNTSTPLAGLDRLMYLRTCQVPPQGIITLPNLTYLLMNKCNIKFVKPRFIQYHSSLNRLYMSENDLTQILNYTFTTSANLFKIDLASNKIISIDRLAFFGLTTLCEIWLQENQLHSTFPLEMTAIQIVGLQSNQVCSFCVSFYPAIAPTDDV